VNRKEYFRALAGVIRALVVQGGVTLLGRGSAFLVEQNEGLRVRLTAPLEKRLANLREFYDIEGKVAREKLARNERDRAEFIKRYYKADLAGSNNYDLTINMGRMTPTAAADIVQRALEPLQR
jgi:cytidylate kinase